MKKAILPFLGIMMSSTLAGADLITAIDPWGNHRQAGELRAKRDELNSLKASQEDILNKEKTELATVSRDVAERKSRFEGLRSKVSSVLLNDNRQLADLVKSQQGQLQGAETAFNQAVQISDQVNAAMSALTTLQSRALAIQILEPIFANTETNRQLWLDALDQVEKQQGLSQQDVAEILELRRQIGAANDWFWRRPGLLLGSFNKTMSEFSRGAQRSLIERLKAETDRFISGLKQQVDMQKALVAAIQKLKDDHDAMYKSLN